MVTFASENFSLTALTSITATDALLKIGFIAKNDELDDLIAVA